MATTSTSAGTKTLLGRLGPKELLIQARAFIALFILMVVFSLLSPAFLTASNLVILAKHVAINAIMAVGITFVILTGGIDLSVGSVVGLAGMITGGLINQGLILRPFGVVLYFNIWIIVAIGLLVGAAAGALNGWLVTRYKVAPFIATLGTMYVLRGFAMLRSKGATFPNLVGDPELATNGFTFLGAGLILGIPVSIWLMILFCVAGIFVATRTPFGRQVYAIGGNERAAELSGVRTGRVKLLVYVISGVCAAMTGLIITSELVAAHPATGQSFEMNAIAAVVLGGTSLAGGRGTIGGTIIGAFVIGVLSDGLVLLGVSEFWQMVIKGVVIITAVVIDHLQQRIQSQAAASRLDTGTAAAVGE